MEVYDTYSEEKGSPFDADGMCIDENIQERFLFHDRTNGLSKYKLIQITVILYFLLKM
jgi:hypothetical protein